MNDYISKSDTNYYTEFWQENLQSIEDISSEVINLLRNLRKKNLTIAELDDSIESKINLLISIYSSYNTLKGREYALKMKSVYNEYKSIREKQTAYLNTFDFLLEKTQNFRNESLKEFPQLFHDEKLQNSNKIINNKKVDESKYDFKWVCFCRNGSSFTAKYDNIKVLKSDQVNLIDENKKLSYNDVEYNIIDLFHTSLFSHNDIAPFFIIRNNSDCFAVDSIEKKYMASSNILINDVENYEFNNRFASGYIKLNGRRWIYLKDIID